MVSSSSEKTPILQELPLCAMKIEIGKLYFREGMKKFSGGGGGGGNLFSVSKQNLILPIKLGKQRLTGANCIILKGVTIGDNVMGAGCVIHKDILQFYRD